jgi:5-methyltetrahydrofolate--homocysteine methyltransferase
VVAPHQPEPTARYHWWMNRLTQLLNGRPTAIFDGGMGTLLQERGLIDGGSGELWNVEHPDIIEQIHREYAAAGAAILTTNTFGGTRPRLDMHGLGDRVHELNKAAAQRARAVADELGLLVAGDIGPTGELLSPMGTLEISDAEALFEEQLRGLLEGGIDLVLIETMSDLSEVQAAIQAVQALAPELPIAATMSFDTNLHTMMGVSPAAAVVAIADLGADAVGANCGRGPEEMEAIMRQMVDARPDGILLVAQSNAGLPHLVGDRFEYDAKPVAMASHAEQLNAMGVELVGACCGSEPEHITAMNDALQPATSD